ncbi:MAG: PEGA domain-containing protein [Kofleriaceae bacterium]
MRVALVVLMILLWAPHARADEAADREEARREFNAGQAADKQRDWQGAIEHYLRANDLVAHPNAMFNIATDYERLGKLREAAVWYQRYVEAAQDSPDRDKVVRILRELATRSGTLTVRSVPNGARVSVDGRFAGVTPYSDHIKGGAHRVTLEHQGRSEQREIKIEFGEPAILDVTLRGSSGTLRIVGSPQGALVTVDRIPAGTLPLTMPLEPGVHPVRVTQYGFTTFDTVATITANRESLVDVQLAHGGTIADPTPATTIKAGYLLGAAGGVDARGEGSLFLVELGVRASTLDASIRIGKTAGLTAVDFLVRWSFTKGRIAPFVSAGYTAVKQSDDDGVANENTGGGYMLTGGLRWDFARSEHTWLSLVLESGVRYFAGLDGTEGRTSEGTSGLIVPIMTSLQITYR